MRKQNKKGEEVGGIVPHVTLKSIANNEPPDQEVLVDWPEPDNKIVRVTGPFVVRSDDSDAGRLGPFARRSGFGEARGDGGRRREETSPTAHSSSA